MLKVLESLGHALRSWIAYGHAPSSIASYYTGGDLGEEHGRAADLIQRYLDEFRRHDAAQ